MVKHASLVSVSVSGAHPPLGGYLHPNYLFLLSVVEARSHGRLLDYGCGDGAMVKGALARGMDAYGVDAFYDGGKRKEAARATGLLGQRIFELDNHHIPFPAAYFDAAVSNEVMEHVDNLDTVAQELARVIRPGGWVLCIFPTMGTWWEGHLCMPLAHIVPDTLGLRRVFVFLLHCCGFGRREKAQRAWEWAGNKCDYLRRCTRYRTDREVEATFLRYFDQLEMLEVDWLLLRLEVARSPLRIIFKNIARTSIGRITIAWMVRKRANRVLFACLANSPHVPSVESSI
jgi:SAM-dependent methyltransferase